MGLLDEFVSGLVSNLTDSSGEAFSGWLGRRRHGVVVRVLLGIVLALAFFAAGGLWVGAAIGEAAGWMDRVDDDLLLMGCLGALMVSLGVSLAGIAVFQMVRHRWPGARLARLLRWTLGPMVFLFCALIIAGFLSEVIDVARESLDGAVGMLVVGGVILAWVVRAWINGYRDSVATARTQGLPSPRTPTDVAEGQGPRDAEGRSRT